jgi:hypothetical protein
MPVSSLLKLLVTKIREWKENEQPEDGKEN